MDEPHHATPELGIALDTVCSIVVRAREFDAKEAVVEEDYGSNPIDEGFRSVLEAYLDDPTFQELQSAIDGLNEDEQSALVALVWVGRGDYDLGQWNEALAVAAAAAPVRPRAIFSGSLFSGTIWKRGSLLSDFPVSISPPEQSSVGNASASGRSGRAVLTGIHLSDLADRVTARS